MEKLFYSIGEVSELLGESVSLVRFWTNSFPRHLNPRRNAKGNRLYTADDIEVLRQIHFLVKERRLTLDGANKILLAEKSGVDRSVKALESLKEIRAQLVEIKKSL